MRAPDVDLWPRIAPHRWKWSYGRLGVDGIIWHASRSTHRYTPEVELQAVINWFTDPDNGDWGAGIAGMSNYAIGGGKLVRCVPEELVPRYSAGVHDFRAISIEVVQGLPDMEYDPRDIALCQELAADLSHRCGFPRRRIPFVDGANTGWPGEVGHEDTAQGRGSGKSDPGPLFWRDYRMEGPVSAVTREEFEALKADYFAAREDFYTNVAWQFNIEELRSAVADLRDARDVLRLIQGEQGQRIQAIEDSMRHRQFTAPVLP